jgi:hypothetical protein
VNSESGTSAPSWGTGWFYDLVDNRLNLSIVDNLAGQAFFVNTQFLQTVAIGASPEYLALMERTPIGPGRGTSVGKVALEHVTVQIVDALNDPEYQFREAQQMAGFRTLLGVPMFKEDLPSGVVVV